MPTRAQNSWNGFTTRPLNAVATPQPIVAIQTMRTVRQRSASHASGIAPSTSATPPKLRDADQRRVAHVQRVLDVGGEHRDGQTFELLGHGDERQQHHHDAPPLGRARRAASAPRRRRAAGRRAGRDGRARRLFLLPLGFFVEHGRDEGGWIVVQHIHPIVHKSPYATGSPM